MKAPLPLCPPREEGRKRSLSTDKQRTDLALFERLLELLTRLQQTNVMGDFIRCDAEQREALEKLRILQSWVCLSSDNEALPEKSTVLISLLEVLRQTSISQGMVKSSQI